MRVLCEKGRSQIENSDLVRTSTSNTGFAVSASVVYKSTARRSPNLIDSFHKVHHNPFLLSFLRFLYLVRRQHKFLVLSVT